MGLLLAALLLCCSACRGLVPGAAARQPATRSVCQQLATEFGAPTLAFPTTAEEVAYLGQNDLLVLLVEEPRQQMLADDAVRAALRSYVQAGGRLLLLGYAAALVHELGIEPRAPDRCAPYRWGDDKRTALGRYEFGFQATEHTVSSLLTGLREVEGAARAFHLGGGELVAAPCCHWEREDPARGLVLGRLHRRRDGELRELDAVVLGYWQFGRGGVLAYGNMPEPWRPGAAIQHNAQVFLRNAVRSLGRGSSQSLAVCLAPAGARPELRGWSLPPLARRRHPGRAMLPHWGYQAATQYQHQGRAVLQPQLLINKLLRPAAAAGADLLQLRLADAERGYPLEWGASDPIPRPPGYRGGPFWPSWGAAGLRRLARLAGALGVQTQALLSQELVPGGTGAETADALRFFSRELCDPRLWPEAGLSGLLSDAHLPAGLPRGFVQRYAPRAGLWAVDESAARAELPRVLPARRGQPRGLRSSGLSDSWRSVFDPRRYPLGILDCRTQAPGPQDWPGADGDGVGSYGDWVLTQLNDFVRPRMGLGAGVWWRAYRPRSSDAATLAYVQGLSMLPIKAAFAGRLWATGKGGYREISAQQLGAVQGGYGAESTLPATTAVLQNNHFRLHGFGGPLQVDPKALARFTGPGVSPPRAEAFLHTRWQRLKYDLELEPAEDIQFVSAEKRTAGGYGEICLIPASRRGGASFPERLDLGAAGRWPRGVQLEFQGVRTNYSLELRLRGPGEAAVLEIRREGRLQRLVGVPGGGQFRQLALPFPVAESGLRRFSLQLVEGGAVEILGCRLRPQGTLPENNAVPTELRIGARAGARASLVAVSGSKAVQEHKQLITHADFPGFVLSIRYGSLVRGLRDERRFGLGGYQKIEESYGQVGRVIRGGVRLGHVEPGMPGLLVLPLQPLPRYHHLRWDATHKRLSLRGAPTSKMEVQLGFLFLREGADPGLDEAVAMLRGLLQPPEHELPDNGLLRVPALAAPAHARVLRLIQDDPAPVLVRERGIWYQRGTAAADARGRWLHLYQLDREPVLVRGLGPGLDLPRPAAGSAGSICWREPRSHSVEVEVLEAGPLLPAPGIVMPVAFNRVLLDGQPWRYFEDRTVYLPRRPGRYQIEVGTRIETRPQLLGTDLEVSACQYLPRRGGLALVFADYRPGRDRFIRVSAGLRRVLGAERLDAADLGYSPAQALRAGERGEQLRVVADKVLLIYDEPAAAAVR